MPFTLRQLDYFVAVAEAGSLTAAARSRNVSQPSVSVYITELEAGLGQALFQRQAGQSLSITPAGRRLLIKARTVLASAGEIVAGRSDEVSRIAVACFRDIGPMYLPRILTALMEEDPNIVASLSEGDLVDVRAQILDGRCDIAITYNIDLEGRGIVVDPIDSLSPYVMLRSGHHLTKRTAIGLADLASERLVLEDFPVTRDYFLDMFKRGGVEPGIVQNVSSFEMQRGLVARGWGVGLSCVRPKSDASYDGSALVCLPLADPQPHQTIGLAHLGVRTLSPAVRKFRDLAMRLGPPR
jgi:DNA-binding transcriptional LysR family regulator